MILAALALAAGPAARVDAVARDAGLAGVVLVAKGDKVLLERGYGTVAPDGGKRHDPKARWRLASITKQITATLLMQDVAKGKTGLDVVLAPRMDLPQLGDITLRHLLGHRTTLPNPSEGVENAAGVPVFYATPGAGVRDCLSRLAQATDTFRYNNCDYLVAGALLAYRMADDDFLPAGIGLARRDDVLVQGYVKGAPEPAFLLENYGLAGSMTGTARALFGFDRDLMAGRLLPASARDELWRGDPKQGYAALGQWVFPATLKGCTQPIRIVQRDGEILGVQTRNYILPDADMVVIVFTNRSADDFTIGDIWRGSGFAYDLLSAAACPA